jgi:hypothetical protein
VSMHDMRRPVQRLMVVGLLSLAAPSALIVPALAASGPASSHATVMLGTGTSRSATARVAGPEVAFNLPAAFDQHTQWLTEFPDSSVDPPTCISRTIGLDGGHYTLQQYIRPDDNSGFVDILQTGVMYNNTTTQNTWTWRDCLNIVGGDYWIHTTLTAPNGSQVSESSGDFGVTSGYYVWGSSLQPSSDVH